jgi:hypothetical protein
VSFGKVSLTPPCILSTSGASYIQNVHTLRGHSTFLIGLQLRLSRITAAASVLGLTIGQHSDNRHSGHPLSRQAMELCPQLLQWSNIITPALPLMFVLYIVLCSILRFQRRDTMQRKFNYPDRQSLSRMTNADAQAITVYLLELEFPKMYYTSIQFALFKTYGIPTISKLLATTSQFNTAQNASKRYADTSILISEFMSHHPRSERVFKALARMNYIHSGYQRAGKISQEDLLYTLSVFITEPITWVEKYEWRTMTDMEKCAIGTFWKSIGDAMGIQYNSRLYSDNWKDGLHFYEEISTWAEVYEAKYMVPAETNKEMAYQL